MLDIDKQVSNLLSMLNIDKVSRDLCVLNIDRKKWKNEETSHFHEALNIHERPEASNLHETLMRRRRIKRSVFMRT